jgi:hypothetical protein
MIYRIIISPIIFAIGCLISFAACFFPLCILSPAGFVGMIAYLIIKIINLGLKDNKKLIIMIDEWTVKQKNKIQGYEIERTNEDSFYFCFLAATSPFWIPFYVTHQFILTGELNFSFS